MVAEVGLLALIIALCLSLVLSIFPLIGSYSGDLRLMGQARFLCVGLLVFVALSFACLVWAFISNDFSVDYVARHSNSLLPLQYKISATWGGHEGSLLLWVLILVGWMAAVAGKSDHLPPELVARVLAVMGMVTVGFLLFTVLTSNPFSRLLPFPPSDGADLNPLLQDVGLIVHPPMLYMGYVGFAVTFAFAIAALLGGQLDSAWARWVRPWTTVAWLFLTLGIALGSWWAYYELGWGGWWFWDPVENASLMPWLVGTALMHSLAVTEKRGLFKSWTLLLAIFTFSLSLLGTFLVRSGVLTSVHAFANDPERGVFILIYLMIVVGASLALFALRAPRVGSRIHFTALSRETLLLVNNILLTASAATVLLGTLFPLLLESLDQGMISVGPPYFNTMFVPMTLLLAFALGVGVLLNWKGSSAQWLISQTRWIVLVCVTGGFAFAIIYGQGVRVSEVLAITLVLWIVLTMVKDIFNKTRNASGLWRGLLRLQPAYLGMHLAHFGLAVTIVGVVISSGYSMQRDLRMAPGDRVSLGDYQFRFDGVGIQNGPNYHSEYGSVTMYEDGRQITVLHPEKRLYTTQGMPMTEAAIDPGFTRDIYVALGEPLGSDGSWALRLHIKPFVRWIWLGAIFMALGGALAVSDRRYRAKVRRAVSWCSSEEVTSA